MHTSMLRYFLRGTRLEINLLGQEDACVWTGGGWDVRCDQRYCYDNKFWSAILDGDADTVASRFLLVMVSMANSCSESWTSLTTPTILHASFSCCLFAGAWGFGILKSSPPSPRQAGCWGSRCHGIWSCSETAMRHHSKVKGKEQAIL